MERRTRERDRTQIVNAKEILFDLQGEKQLALFYAGPKACFQKERIFYSGVCTKVSILITDILAIIPDRSTPCFTEFLRSSRTICLVSAPEVGPGGTV